MVPESTKEPKGHIPLDASEMANLWTTYMNDSMFLRVYQYFRQNLKDADILPLISYAIDLINDHLQIIERIFKAENTPIPVGFAEHDVDLSAPPLFTESFILAYVENVGKFQASNYTVALANSSRIDVRGFFTECTTSSMELFNRSMEIALSKGLHNRAPVIPSPDKIDFVEEQRFLTGWFGDRRALTAIEIMNLFFNFKRNELGNWLLTGFSQVAKAENVRDFLLKGQQIAAKHMEIFGSVLRENNLPVSMMSDPGVTLSMVPPFSDKLMMFHTTALVAAGIGFYGAAVGTCTRRDLSAHFVRLAAEIAGYAEDGAHIMIQNGWLEQPPQAPDREKLAVT